jgi:uncharacterized membrane protein
VPALLVGSTLLVGSSEIPAQFPGMVRQALAGSGIDWPTLPGIQRLVQERGLAEPAAPPAAARAPDSSARSAPPPAAASQETIPPAAVPAPDTAVAAEVPPPAAAELPAADGVQLLDESGMASPSAFARFQTDPVGNSVAVAVLFLMLLALGAVAAAVAGRLTWRPGPEWLVPVLSLVGIGVAGYLAVVEVTGAEAVCGPVGDCNTVQQSPYARLAGVLPVGVFGVFGYLLLLGAWGLALAGPEPRRGFARVVLWGAALLGTLFSVYLTFLEPFVIGATCAWCITSALLMTLLLLHTTPRALAVRADTRATVH